MFKCWLWFGVTILKWQFIDIYTPDKEIVIAVTFSHDKEYVDKVSKVE